MPRRGRLRRRTPKQRFPLRATRPSWRPEPKPSAVGFEIMGPNGERTVVPLDRLEVREATGSLEGLDGGQLTLAVGGRRYVCPLLAECAFADEKGQPMNRAAFAQRFLRRYVRVEMERTTGTVLSCRAM